MLIEKIKTDASLLGRWLEQRGYKVIEAGINVVAIHASDRSLADIVLQDERQPALT
jgi:hypothetical protein